MNSRICLDQKMTIYLSKLRLKINQLLYLAKKKIRKRVATINLWFHAKITQNHKKLSKTRVCRICCKSLRLFRIPKFKKSRTNFLMVKKTGNYMLSIWWIESHCRPSEKAMVTIKIQTCLKHSVMRITPKAWRCRRGIWLVSRCSELQVPMT